MGGYSNSGKKIIGKAKIITKKDMKRVRKMEYFRHAVEDLLVCDIVIPFQSWARDIIRQAMNFLIFMDSTGLKLAKQRFYPNEDYENKIPESDHNIDWYDHETGQGIVTDEPYQKIDENNKERIAWAKKHNWHLELSTWPGMHNPRCKENSILYCRMFVATDASKNFNFRKLMNKINNLPAPITKSNWNGIYSGDYEPFISPKTITPQDKRRVRCKEYYMN